MVDWDLLNHAKQIIQVLPEESFLGHLGCANLVVIAVHGGGGGSCVNLVVIAVHGGGG